MDSTLFFKEKLNYFDTLQSFFPHSWIFKPSEKKQVLQIGEFTELFRIQNHDSFNLTS